jgi:hypothetical protein
MEEICNMKPGDLVRFQKWLFETYTGIRLYLDDTSGNQYEFLNHQLKDTPGIFLGVSNNSNLIRVLFPFGIRLVNPKDMEIIR